MDSVANLSGLQLAACIVRRDFQTVCPQYTVRGHGPPPSKKAKVDSGAEEQVLYRPFCHDAAAAGRYLAESPRAVEVFDLIRGDDPNAQRPGLALLWFLLARCGAEEQRQQLADHVLTKLCERMPALVALGDAAVHYLLSVVLECVHAAPIEKTRFFLASSGLHKVFGKHSVPKGSCAAFRVAGFYADLARRGVVDDVGLCGFVPAEGGAVDDLADVGDAAELRHANGKKQLCLLLLLGLKGFNILERPSAVRQVFDHVRQEALVDSICIIWLFIRVMANIMGTQCARLALTLRDTQWSDVPESAISATVAALSHAFAQVTASPGHDQERAVRLNALLLAIGSDFVAGLQDICDVATLAGVLVKFDAAQLATADIVLPVLRANRAVGGLYMPMLRCKYNGTLEYMALLKFLTEWFDHASGAAVGAEECLARVPPVLSQHFFNSGLLSADEWTRRGTLRMLAALIRFAISATRADRGSSASAAVVEHVCGIIPDFKTLVNAKPAARREGAAGGATISLNIKNETRAMVSNELGAVVTADCGGLVLGIDGGDEPLTDWLNCLHLYGTFVGVGEGRGLYDPCKLLKEKVISENTAELNAAIGAPSGGGPEAERLGRTLKLDMALVDCLYCLGVGEVHSGVALNKVQSICFHYILRRYLGLKAGLERHPGVPTLREYLRRCEGYVRDVAEGTGVFPVPADPWIEAMRGEGEYHAFTVLFNHCTETPLDALLGSQAAKAAGRPVSFYKCVSCIASTEFEGCLFLRASLEFLLQSCVAADDDLECEECGVRRVNLVAAFRARGGASPLDPVGAVQYVVRAYRLSPGLSKGHVKRVLQVVAGKYELEDRPEARKVTKAGSDLAPAVVGVESAASRGTPLVSEDRYLLACSAVVDSIERFDQDVAALKDFGRIMIDVLSTRCMPVDQRERALKAKWSACGHGRLVTKYGAMDETTLYTHLFSALATLLDGGGKSEVCPEVFDGVGFDDDTRWAQLWYLRRRLGCDGEEAGAMDAAVERMVTVLRGLCDEGDAKYTANRTAVALSLARVFSLVPSTTIEGRAVELLRAALGKVELALECRECDDVLSCDLGFAKYMLDIAASMASALPSAEAGAAAAVLQSSEVLELTEALCARNSGRYFVGDAIESNLFLSLVKMLRALLRCLGPRRVPAAMDREAMCRLVEALARCYRCSHTASDLVVKDIIVGIVTLLSRSVDGPRSVPLKLPPFKDFACVSKPPWGTNRHRSCAKAPAGAGCTCEGSCHHGTTSHGAVRGWGTMASGHSMVSSSSNWLCLNSKRLHMTLLQFPGGFGDRADLKTTFRNLSIMFPPAARRSPDRSDEVFGAIIRLNAILGIQSKCLQQLLVGDPYVYDLAYLIPFFTGRLCAMLHDQLYQYRQELEGAFESMGVGPCEPVEHTVNRFVKVFSLSEARDAAQRLYAQMQPMRFDVDMGEQFSPMLMEQVLRNGVFEMCILGLLYKGLRKEAVRSLGLITKLVQNMLDAAIVRSVAPGSRGPFKLRRVGLFGIYQVHSLLCFLQRCQLYADGGTPVLHVMSAAQLARRVTKPEDPLYQLGNKYLLSRFEPRLDEVPLFFECFSVQDVRERAAFLSFILQLLLSSVHLMGDHGIFFRRRVLQQLMSFALLETTSSEHRLQIGAFVQRLVLSWSGAVADLYSIGTATWVSTMSATVCGSVFTDTKEIVVTTLLLRSLTLLVRHLGFAVSGHLRLGGVQVTVEDASQGNCESSGATDPSTSAVIFKSSRTVRPVGSGVRDFTSTFEALQRVADAWCHIIGHIPEENLTLFRREGYRTYALVMYEVLCALRRGVEASTPRAGETVSTLLSTAMASAEAAVGRAGAVLLDQGDRVQP
ncbi:nucleolar pre-ribosomal-associated protein 1-like protein [Babesia caballi]|uniref:Nucleolar pre-ribosomal-associated protein 1-like protein n=1 Tax=Babesia caballi TaxID=5871 RepID=A0AAV4LVM3_BABCB|nr:nucleolar pre-ribosomal-associated protein 1-like protein [Babesia caballi]